MVYGFDLDKFEVKFEKRFKEHSVVWGTEGTKEVVPDSWCGKPAGEQ
jgi:hypothetical protein